MTLRVLTLLLVALLLALPAVAKSSKSSSKQSRNLRTENVIHVSFSAAEKHIIRTELLQTHPKLPQGLEKRLAHGKRLPPGWQNKLVKGKRLDRDVYRDSVPLPGKVLDRLPSLEAGVELIWSDNIVMKVQVGTHILLDYFQLRTR